MTYYLLGLATGVGLMLLKDAPWAKWKALLAARLGKKE